jgi:hypothetical protein
VLGLFVLVLIIAARFVAFVWAIRRVVVDRFGLGITAVFVGGALAALTLAPQLAALVFWPFAYAGLVVVLDVVPVVVAWRREHAAAQGSEDEARASRIVRDLLPLAILDAGRLILVALIEWLNAI